MQPEAVHHVSTAYRILRQLMQATANPVTAAAAAAATTSTGVFLGNPAYGNFNTANANPQLYAQQLQGMIANLHALTLCSTWLAAMVCAFFTVLAVCITRLAKLSERCCSIVLMLHLALGACHCNVAFMHISCMQVSHVVPCQRRCIQRLLLRLQPMLPGLQLPFSNRDLQACKACQSFVHNLVQCCVNGPCEIVEVFLWA